MNDWKVSYIQDDKRQCVMVRASGVIEAIAKSKVDQSCIVGCNLLIKPDWSKKW